MNLFSTRELIQFNFPPPRRRYLYIYLLAPKEKKRSFSAWWCSFKFPRNATLTLLSSRTKPVLRLIFIYVMWIIRVRMTLEYVSYIFKIKNILIQKKKIEIKYLQLYSINFLVSAYLRRGHYNVILINWSKLAVLPWYITAVKNARIVGRYFAHVMRWLEAQKAISLSKIHVIGFSLGAEAAGFMGKALAPRKVRRIS